MYYTSTSIEHTTVITRYIYLWVEVIVYHLRPPQLDPLLALSLVQIHDWITLGEPVQIH